MPSKPLKKRSPEKENATQFKSASAICLLPTERALNVSLCGKKEAILTMDHPRGMFIVSNYFQIAK